MLQVLNLPKAEAAEPPVQVVVSLTPESIEKLAYDKAEKYHLHSPKVFVETMRRESMGFHDAAIQSQYIRKDGSREPSFGVCQFFIPSVLKTADGFDVTKDIAIDPEKCLDAAAYNFSIGNANQWTEYRLIEAGQ